MVYTLTLVVTVILLSLGSSVGYLCSSNLTILTFKLGIINILTEQMFMRLYEYLCALNRASVCKTQKA
jgi:hypothetical protein